MLQAITNCVIYTGDAVLRNRNIIIENGVIQSLSDKIPLTADIIDAEGKNISPAFIDIQPNGGYNLYFSKEVSEAALADMYQASIDHGTGYILPTLISSDFETIIKAINVVKQFRKKQPGILGCTWKSVY